MPQLLFAALRLCVRFSPPVLAMDPIQENQLNSLMTPVWAPP